MADMDGDGIDDALEGQMRLLITAAGQAGEALARLREEQLRRAERENWQEARQLQSRFEAELAAARVQLVDVQDDTFWQAATAEQVGQRYQLARAWEREDPMAEQAARRIEAESQARFGLSAADLPVRPQDEFAQARDWYQANRPEAYDRWSERYMNNDTSDGRRSDERELVRGWRQAQQESAAERAEAVVLVDQANRADQRADDARAAASEADDLHDREAFTAAAEDARAAAADARAQSGVKYDSVERRDATAAELRAKGISENDVDVRMSVDTSHGKPATAAVKSGPRSAPKARKKPTGHGAAQQRAGRH